VNVLLMYAERSSVKNFLDSVAKGVRRRNAVGAYAMVPDAVADDTYETFVELFDDEYDHSDADD